MNALRGKNPGNKHPDFTLLPPFDLLPWLFQPEARVHKEAFDGGYTFPRAKGKGWRRVQGHEGQMEDTGASKKGCLWTN